MTCYVDPQTGDVYDHTETVVGNIEDSHGWNYTWTGDYPNEAVDVLYAARDPDSATAYNQQLLLAVSAGRIEMETPTE